MIGLAIPFDFVKPCLLLTTLNLFPPASAPVSKATFASAATIETFSYNIKWMQPFLIPFWISLAFE